MMKLNAITLPASVPLDDREDLPGDGGHDPLVLIRCHLVPLIADLDPLAVMWMRYTAIINNR